jgi:uncharacterized protein with NAD-binding domain and iron-sulfur cluster
VWLSLKRSAQVCYVYIHTTGIAGLAGAIYYFSIGIYNLLLLSARLRSGGKGNSSQLDIMCSQIGYFQLAEGHVGGKYPTVSYK